MAAWSGQVHHHQDEISASGLQRTVKVIDRMMRVMEHVEEYTYILPPHYALADSLIHKDHRIMPPDEIDPDYIERDERAGLIAALQDLGCSLEDAKCLAAPYDEVLSHSDPADDFSAS